VSRLIELADAEIIPHIRIDGGTPLFEAKETKKWVANSLIQRYEGKELPFNLRVVSERPLADKLNIPKPLKEIEGLQDITDVLDLRSGIYFLFLNDDVVYVGQSIKVSSRIHEHVYVKDFNRVLFMKWPKSDLDRIEGALIRDIKPKLNYTKQGFLLGTGNPDNDEVVLSLIKSSVL